MRRLALIAVLLACGPKPKPAPIPVLPGDGDTNTAKPPEPPTTKPQANDPWAGRTDLIVPPAPQPPAKLDIPAVEQLKLANGLQVFIIKSPRLPVVSMQLAIKAGRQNEP